MEFTYKGARAAVRGRAFGAGRLPGAGALLGRGYQHNADLKRASFASSNSGSKVEAVRKLLIYLD